MVLKRRDRRNVLFHSADSSEGLPTNPGYGIAAGIRFASYFRTIGSKTVSSTSTTLAKASPRRRICDRTVRAAAIHVSQQTVHGRWESVA